MDKHDEDLLQDSFFRPETRCGYYVSGTMKKVWAVELDLLRKFVEVCEKYDLQYFMDGGTLLGAVRHQGFIPWDDDVDVIMPRKDYNKLWSIAAGEFTDPYFFQTTLSEERFFRTHAQLRNSRITGFVEEDREKDVNKGIFLDIFVLDNIPDNFYRKQLWRIEIELKKKIFAFQYDRNYKNLSCKGKVFYCFVHFLFSIISFRKAFAKFNLRTLGRYMDKQTENVGDVTLDWRANVQWPAVWFGDHVCLPFENLMLRAPVFYEGVLTRQYGDYSKLPEDVMAPELRSHGIVTFEPEIPYKEFFEKQMDKNRKAEKGYERCDYHCRRCGKADGAGNPQTVHKCI